MKSGLDKITDWLAGLEMKKVWAVMVAISMIICLFGLTYQAGKMAVIKEVTRCEFTVQQNEDTTTLIDPEGNRQVYQNEYTFEFKKEKPKIDFNNRAFVDHDNYKGLCKLREDGLPEGFRLFKSQTGKWQFADWNNFSSVIDMRDNKKEVIERAQDWCDSLMSKEIDNTTVWEEVK